ncbi:hypothetical protein KI387_011320, partial [Taxus chinensis]
MSEHFVQKRIDEFHDLRQGSGTVAQYESRFLDLLQYVDYLQDEKLQVNRFIRGLNADIAGAVRMLSPPTLEKAVEKAYLAEENRTKAQEHRDRNKSKFQERIQAFQ